MAKQIRPTDSELEILNILWSNGPQTVRQVHDELGRQRDIGYTTVLKLMQIMFEKKLLTRDESSRSHIYSAKYCAEQTQKQLVKDLVKRAFGGSTEKLVMQALSAKRATPEEINEIRRLLDEMEGDSR